MKDLGAATFLLGMEIRRLPGGDIKLLRKKYLGEVLQRFYNDATRQELINPSFKEFFRTNTLSHQCPYTEHAHFN